MPRTRVQGGRGAPSRGTGHSVASGGGAPPVSSASSQVLPGKNACNGRQKNQHQATPADWILAPYLEAAMRLGLSDAKTALYVRRRIDGAKCCTKTIQRARGRMNLLKTVMQGHTSESILPIMLDIKREFPQMGARTMTKTLRIHSGICVPEAVVLDTLRAIEPEAVEARKHRGFTRRTFYTVGVNEFWCLDQHDKMKKFGLRYHVCIEPMAGRIMWLRIWWTNSNPRIVLKYFLDAVREQGFIPSFTMSDRGTENNLVANVQTLLRQALDGTLDDTILHRWMIEHGNIKPEIFWSGMRKDWSPGFEKELEKGGFDGMGVFDPSDAIDMLLFRYLAIPWLQERLDDYKTYFNMTKRRADKEKWLPDGIPDMIFNDPSGFGCADVKEDIHSVMGLVDELEERWVPEGHPVRELVPSDFKKIVDKAYVDILKSPVVNIDSLWAVFSLTKVQLLRVMEVSVPRSFVPAMEGVLKNVDNIHKEVVGLLENYKRLRKRPQWTGTGNGPILLDVGDEYLEDEDWDEDEAEIDARVNLPEALMAVNISDIE